MDPKNSGPNGHFVATKKIVSRHSWHLCSPALVVACSLCHNIILCIFFQLCQDKVVLKQSYFCNNRGLSCCDNSWMP